MLDLKKYNSFYTNKLCRPVVFKLSKGICNGCETKMEMNEDYHVGHIIPRSEPESFKLYFPELDVDNVLNLHALCSKCNLKANKYQTYSPFMLNQMFNENLRKIEQRIEKSIKEEDFADISSIETFLNDNPNIDLFSNMGKKYKNKEILQSIKILYNLDTLNPVIDDKSGKYFIIDHNSIVKEYAIAIMDINNIENIDNKMDSLSYSRLKNIEVNSKKVLIANKNRIKKKLKEKIVELGKELIKT